MIRKQSILYVADNSGARTGLCVSTPIGFIANIGDKVLLSIQSGSTAAKVKNGELVKATIVRLKKSSPRRDGSSFAFQTNAAVLLNTQELPLSKRIFGPVSYVLRQKKAFKLLFLASVVL